MDGVMVDVGSVESGAATRKSGRFLFVLWEGGGNVPPILGVARRLVECGHTVQVISDPCNEAEARAAGCEFVSYTRAPRRLDKTAASTIVKDYEASDTPGGLRVVLDTMACGPALEYARDVLAALDRFPADAVVASELLLGGCFAAEAARLPCAMLIPGTYTLPAPGMPPPGMMPLGGPAGWIREWVAASVFRRLFAYGLPGVARARSALNLSPVTDIPGYLRECVARTLVLTSPAFEFPARFPANVRYAGPILDDPVGSADGEPARSDADEHPRVLVSFSSTYQGQEALMQKVADALGQTTYRGLVTTGPAIRPDQIGAPPNVTVRTFVPHSQVLPYVAAVVTHGGHGTVIRALAHGVPLVCLPIGRDQPANAARVMYHGAGTRLDPQASAADIASAIRTVVEKPAYREHARQLAAPIMRDAEGSVAVEELQRVAGVNVTTR